MTREEAIHILESGGWWDLLDPSGSDADLDTLDEAIDVALAALRAQQIHAKLYRSRWEGCDYCNDPQPYRDCVLPGGTEQMLCALDDRPFAQCYINTRHIEFCPFCGRPLTEEAWEELERRINGGTAD